jgi:HPt (histidine-containing phosphotransfer) domain-containing protein
MATSIDLKMLQTIAFNDRQLLKDMLQEWLTDAADRKEKIVKSIQDNRQQEFFNAVHQLKSNYQMIGCAEAIHLLEKMIKDKVEGADLHFSALETLQQDAISQINIYLSH